MGEKAKKHKRPKIARRVLARPRLNALFDRHARGELDDDGLQAGLQALMAEVGHGPLLDALVKRMEGTPEAERETLMAILPRLRSPEVVERGARRMDIRMYRVGLARAQATIAAAVEANRAYEIPLPKELNEARHLVERWVLHPPASALASDSTDDELGDRPLVPDRSGRPVLVDMRDLRHMGKRK